MLAEIHEASQKGSNREGPTGGRATQNRKALQEHISGRRPLPEEGRGGGAEDGRRVGGEEEGEEGAGSGGAGGVGGVEGAGEGKEGEREVEEAAEKMEKMNLSE